MSNSTNCHNMAMITSMSDSTLWPMITSISNSTKCPNMAMITKSKIMDKIIITKEMLQEVANSINHYKEPTTKTTEDLLTKIYTYHKPDEKAILLMQDIREKAKELALLIVNECPDEEETLIALQKLREVSMWTNAAISMYPKS